MNAFDVLADALATVTVALTRPAAGRPPTRTLRAALYRHAFNSGRHAAWTDPAPARVLTWLARASLPVAQLSDPGVIRAAMDALTVRLDGGRAAAATVTRSARCSGQHRGPQPRSTRRPLPVPPRCG